MKAHQISTFFWLYLILMNCKEYGDCQSAFNEFLSTDLNRLRKPYYQPGMTEDEIKIFDPKSIIDDFKFILEHYKPIDRYEALKGQVFVMWVKR